MSHIRFSVLAVATFVLVGAFSMTALSQDLLTQKVISMEMAQTMAQATVAQYREAMADPPAPREHPETLPC